MVATMEAGPEASVLYEMQRPAKYAAVASPD